MSQQLRSLTRRTFLRGAGVALGLPLLEAMMPRSLRAGEAEPVRRMACFYVPNGVCNAEWIPAEAGSQYPLSPTLRVLEEFKEELTVISGICHSRVEGDHSGGDSFLTAAHIGSTPGYDYKNSISMDQVAAEHLGRSTRFPSLVLSREGGTGSARNTTTMSFSRSGVPLAAENNPRLVFERLFQDDSPQALAAMRKRLAEERSILDLVQESSRSLHRRLGRSDRQKLDEYLESVRSLEAQVERSERWLNVPRKSVDGKNLNLDVSPRSNDDLKQYLQTMFDLIFLAFQTDTTRVCTYQLALEVANNPFTKFLGFTETHHGLSHHGGDPDLLKKLAEVDRFYLARFAEFLGKLKGAGEADGTMLDHTLMLYGSGMNNGERGGHYSTNLPILFAGGRKLSFKQGQHLAYRQSEHKGYKDRPAAPPLSNLFQMMLQRLGVPVKSFADSTGLIPELA